MRKFFDICKIFKPPFECVVSVNNFVFFIQNYYSIPKLPKKIELLHVYYYISIPKTGQFVKNIPQYYQMFQEEKMNGFKKIGEKIKFYREKRGITLETLARHTYISKNRLEEIENGQAIYQFWTLQKIAKALEIDLPELLNFD